MVWTNRALEQIKQCVHKLKIWWIYQTKTQTWLDIKSGQVHSLYEAPNIWSYPWEGCLQCWSMKSNLLTNLKVNIIVVHGMYMTVIKSILSLMDHHCLMKLEMTNQEIMIIRFLWNEIYRQMDIKSLCLEHAVIFWIDSDIMSENHFLHYMPFVLRNCWSLVDCPYKWPVIQSFDFFLCCLLE